MKKPTYCSNANYDVFIQLVTILSFTFGAEENSYFSQEKRGASVFCSKSKKYFFLIRKHAFYENHKKNIESVIRKVVSRAQFLSYFLSFCANGKRMPVILNVRIDMILQRMDKTEGFLRKTQHFDLGQVTLGVSR